MKTSKKMDKSTNDNDRKPEVPSPSVEREFQWRLTDKDKRFLRSMNISPE